jgi:hypothetical protein
MQAKINFQIRTVPTDGINAANYESGDFGRSPFLGQLSGKPQPASAYASMVPRSKHKGASRPQFEAEVVVTVCGQFAPCGVGLFLTSRSPASLSGLPPRFQSGRTLRATWR